MQITMPFSFKFASNSLNTLLIVTLCCHLFISVSSNPSLSGLVTVNDDNDQMQEESASYLQFSKIPDEEDTRKILLQLGNQSSQTSNYDLDLSVSGSSNSAQIVSNYDNLNLQQQLQTNEDPLQKILPKVKFECKNRKEGYYADLDFDCEVFHYCKSNGFRFTLVCPPKAKYSQKAMTCVNEDSELYVCSEENNLSNENSIKTNLNTTNSFLSIYSSNENNKQNNSIFELEKNSDLRTGHSNDQTSLQNDLTQQNSFSNWKDFINNKNKLINNYINKKSNQNLTNSNEFNSTLNLSNKMGDKNLGEQDITNNNLPVETFQNEYGSRLNLPKNINQSNKKSTLIYEDLYTKYQKRKKQINSTTPSTLTNLSNINEIDNQTTQSTQLYLTDEILNTFSTIKSKDLYFTDKSTQNLNLFKTNSTNINFDHFSGNAENTENNNNENTSDGETTDNNNENNNLSINNNNNNENIHNFNQNLNNNLMSFNNNFSNFNLNTNLSGSQESLNYPYLNMNEVHNSRSLEKIDTNFDNQLTDSGFQPILMRHSSHQSNSSKKSNNKFKFNLENNQIIKNNQETNKVNNVNDHLDIDLNNNLGNNLINLDKTKDLNLKNDPQLNLFLSSDELNSNEFTTPKNQDLNPVYKLNKNKNYHEPLNDKSFNQTLKENRNVQTRENFKLMVKEVSIQKLEDFIKNNDLIDVTTIKPISQIAPQIYVKNKYEENNYKKIKLIKQPFNNSLPIYSNEKIFPTYSPKLTSKNKSNNLINYYPNINNLNKNYNSYTLDTLNSEYPNYKYDYVFGLSKLISQPPFFLNSPNQVPTILPDLNFMLKYPYLFTDFYTNTLPAPNLNKNKKSKLTNKEMLSNSANNQQISSILNSNWFKNKFSLKNAAINRNTATNNPFINMNNFMHSSAASSFNYPLYELPPPSIVKQQQKQQHITYQNQPSSSLQMPLSLIPNIPNSFLLQSSLTNTNAFNNKFNPSNLIMKNILNTNTNKNSNMNTKAINSINNMNNNNNIINNNNNQPNTNQPNPNSFLSLSNTRKTLFSQLSRLFSSASMPRPVRVPYSTNLASAFSSLTQPFSKLQIDNLSNQFLNPLNRFLNATTSYIPLKEINPFNTNKNTNNNELKTNLNEDQDELDQLEEQILNSNNISPFLNSDSSSKPILAHTSSSSNSYLSPADAQINTQTEPNTNLATNNLLNNHYLTYPNQMHSHLMHSPEQIFFNPAIKRSSSLPWLNQIDQIKFKNDLTRKNVLNKNWNSFRSNTNKNQDNLNYLHNFNNNHNQFPDFQQAQTFQANLANLAHQTPSIYLNNQEKSALLTHSPGLAHSLPSANLKSSTYLTKPEKDTDSLIESVFDFELTKYLNETNSNKLRKKRSIALAAIPSPPLSLIPSNPAAQTIQYPKFIYPYSYPVLTTSLASPLTYPYSPYFSMDSSQIPHQYHSLSMPQVVTYPTPTLTNNLRQFHNLGKNGLIEESQNKPSILSTHIMPTPTSSSASSTSSTTSSTTPSSTISFVPLSLASAASQLATSLANISSKHLKNSKLIQLTSNKKQNQTTSQIQPLNANNQTKSVQNKTNFLHPFYDLPTKTIIWQQIPNKPTIAYAAWTFPPYKPYNQYFPDYSFINSASTQSIINTKHPIDFSHYPLQTSSFPSSSYPSNFPHFFNDYNTLGLNNYKSNSIQFIPKYDLKYKPSYSSIRKLEHESILPKDLIKYSYSKDKPNFQENRDLLNDYKHAKLNEDIFLKSSPHNYKPFDQNSLDLDLIKLSLMSSNKNLITLNKNQGKKINYNNDLNNYYQQLSYLNQISSKNLKNSNYNLKLNDLSKTSNNQEYFSSNKMNKLIPEVNQTNYSLSQSSPYSPLYHQQGKTNLNKLPQEKDDYPTKPLLSDFRNNYFEENFFKEFNKHSKNKNIRKLPINYNKNNLNELTDSFEKEDELESNFYEHPNNQQLKNFKSTYSESHLNQDLNSIKPNLPDLKLNKILEKKFSNNKDNIPYYLNSINDQFSVKTKKLLNENKELINKKWHNEDQFQDINSYQSKTNTYNKLNKNPKLLSEDYENEEEENLDEDNLNTIHHKPRYLIKTNSFRIYKKKNELNDQMKLNLDEKEDKDWSILNEKYNEKKRKSKWKSSNFIKDYYLTEYNKNNFNSKNQLKNNLTNNTRSNLIRNSPYNYEILNHSEQEAKLNQNTMFDNHNFDGNKNTIYSSGSANLNDALRTRPTFTVDHSPRKTTYFNQLRSLKHDQPFQAPILHNTKNNDNNLNMNMHPDPDYIDRHYHHHHHYHHSNLDEKNKFNSKLSSNTNKNLNLNLKQKNIKLDKEEEEENLTLNKPYHSTFYENKIEHKNYYKTKLDDLNYKNNLNMPGDYLTFTIKPTNFNYQINKNNLNNLNNLNKLNNLNHLNNHHNDYNSNNHHNQNSENNYHEKKFDLSQTPFHPSNSYQTNTLKSNIFKPKINFNWQTDIKHDYYDQIKPSFKSKFQIHSNLNEQFNETNFNSHFNDKLNLKLKKNTNKILNQDNNLESNVEEVDYEDAINQNSNYNEQNSYNNQNIYNLNNYINQGEDKNQDLSYLNEPNDYKIYPQLVKNNNLKHSSDKESIADNNFMPTSELHQKNKPTKNQNQLIQNKNAKDQLKSINNEPILNKNSNFIDTYKQQKHQLINILYENKHPKTISMKNLKPELKKKNYLKSKQHLNSIKLKSNNQNQFKLNEKLSSETTKTNSSLRNEDKIQTNLTNYIIEKLPHSLDTIFDTIDNEENYDYENEDSNNQSLDNNLNKNNNLNNLNNKLQSKSGDLPENLLKKESKLNSTNLLQNTNRGFGSRLASNNIESKLNSLSNSQNSETFFSHSNSNEPKSSWFLPLIKIKKFNKITKEENNLKNSSNQELKLTQNNQNYLNIIENESRTKSFLNTLIKQKLNQNLDKESFKKSANNHHIIINYNKQDLQQISRDNLNNFNLNENTAKKKSELFSINKFSETNQISQTNQTINPSIKQDKNKTLIHIPKTIYSTSTSTSSSISISKSRKNFDKLKFLNNFKNHNLNFEKTLIKLNNQTISTSANQTQETPFKINLNLNTFQNNQPFKKIFTSLSGGALQSTARRNHR